MKSIDAQLRKITKERALCVLPEITECRKIAKTTEARSMLMGIESMLLNRIRS